jgi:hypothetical protein
MTALRDEFNRDDPNSVGGCYFHWKQALRRKLKELKVPKDLITKLMGDKGLINILTVLQYDEISKCIEYIRYKMAEGEYKSEFDKFWSYFVKIWMKKTTRYDDKSGLYLFNSWNMSHLVGPTGLLAEDENGHDVSVNRTNNPLERFNRLMNEKIPRHPTVQIFVECIKEICNDYVDQMRVIKLKKGKK